MHQALTTENADNGSESLCPCMLRVQFQYWYHVYQTEIFFGLSKRNRFVEHSLLTSPMQTVRHGGSTKTIAVCVFKRDQRSFHADQTLLHITLKSNINKCCLRSKAGLSRTNSCQSRRLRSLSPPLRSTA